MNPVLSISSLTHRRGSFRLSVESLQIDSGSVVGLVGSNGAGKSTLLDIAAGLLPADEGEVRIFGLSPRRDVEAVRRELGWMTDDMPMFAGSITDNLRLLAPFYPSWDWTFANELLRRFGLDPKRKIHQLSKGEGTRARLVTVLAYRPRLLFLDEPTTGLDVPSRRQLMKDLLDVVRDPARSVVISSHQVEDLERIADRVLLLEQGRIIADGSPQEVAGAESTLEERLARRVS